MTLPHLVRFLRHNKTSIHPAAGSRWPPLQQSVRLHGNGPRQWFVPLMSRTILAITCVALRAGYGGNIGPNLDGHEDQFYNNWIAINQDGDYVKPVSRALRL